MKIKTVSPFIINNLKERVTLNNGFFLKGLKTQGSKRNIFLLWFFFSFEQKKQLCHKVTRFTVRLDGIFVFLICCLHF